MELWIFAGVGLIVALGLGLIFSGRDNTQRRYAHMDLTDIRRLNRGDFGAFLADLFRRLGYQATDTQTPEGIDVLVTSPDGTKVAVQTKYWHADYYVGADPVYRAVDASARAGCQQAIIITTRGYTDSAREASRTTGVELWGPEEIADLMERARSGARQTAAPVLVPIAQVAGLHRQPAQPRAERPAPLPISRQAPAPPTPTPIVQPGKHPPRPENPRCPNCGLPMVARIALDRDIWLCSRFPRCRGFAPRR